MSQLHQVGLTFIKNIGPMLAKSMVSYFGDAEEVFKAPKAKWVKLPGIGQKTVEQMDMGAALKRAEEELKFVER